MSKKSHTRRLSRLYALAGTVGVIAALSCASAAPPSSSAAQQAPAGALSIRVKGAKLVDGSEHVVQLRGANVADLAQMETGSNAWPTFGLGGEPIFASMTAWHMNVVRFALNEGDWLRETCGPGVHLDPQGTYQAAVAKAVADANAAGMYVILDLHWAAPGNFCPSGQPSFADADHSVAFWASVANAFKGNPAVMFELFNEPFGDDVWANWFRSDAVLLRDGGSFSAWQQQNSNTGKNNYLDTTASVGGYNSLIAAIRAAGATNVVLASPIGWAGEIQAWEQFKPTDPAGQLAVAWHVYGNHNMSAAQQVLNHGYPIVITETNGKLAAKGGNNIDNQLFNWADAQDVGYLWWSWTPYSPTDDLDVRASCSASGAFRLAAGGCATPTTAGAYYRAGLACAVTGAQNCW